MNVVDRESGYFFDMGGQARAFLAARSLQTQQQQSEWKSCICIDADMPDTDVSPMQSLTSCRYKWGI
ncbi:hypothetical protein UNDYM_1354 [Undibacterium sp. YM2]|nr:hypothetical protein UNDYM_1354 [Undibacterium sp. YM2]